ncbi:uncharacterized protein LOC111023918 isoform X2 [Momordica charantia]|uniref:Uncharacterized protein LOC111023918 isoform X2 n=1 Tax=Momordica charantia TaxID=3673 RepID=A0A6J1DVL2_MOMCH|nr:uncharacterized protein LOC111023918 isoform X2 [Momordica charantia]
MAYDYRNKPGHYDSHPPMYGPPASASPSPSLHPMYGHSMSLYPRIGQQGHSPAPPVARISSHHHSSSPSPPSSSGLGIGVTIKPEYRITPPPQLSPQIRDIPRSNFQFDFEFEKKVLAEAEKETQNWSRFGLDNLPAKPGEPTSTMGSLGDPVASKYIASGLNREAVRFAVANYGDNPTKVQEFAKGYTLLREMGFSSNKVVEALLMYDNDTDKAVAHFLSGTS